MEVITRATSLVGKSKHEYSCNHVVNYALTGDKYFSKWEASDYLSYGEVLKTFNPRAGDVIVADDGSHVGIFISSTTWIHAGQVFTCHPTDPKILIVSSWKLQKVEQVGLNQVRHVFPTGCHLRRQKALPQF